MRQLAMGFYRDRVFPRVMNLACNTRETRRIRRHGMRAAHR